MACAMEEGVGVRGVWGCRGGGRGGGSSLRGGRVPMPQAQKTKEPP